MQILNNMNREIKFRAWHKLRKEMYNIHGWHLEFVFKDTLDGFGNDGNPDLLKDVIIMQFTGLYDKCKKEIFEGDIFKEGKNSLGYIIFDAGRFDIKWIKNKENYNDVLKFNFNSIRVIGNIYENPELLQG